MRTSCSICNTPYEIATFMIPLHDKYVCGDCLDLLNIEDLLKIVSMGDTELNDNATKNNNVEFTTIEDYMEEKPPSSMDDLAEKIQESEKQDDILLSPKEITAVLDAYVIGQKNAKKKLSTAVYNHIKRTRDTTNNIQKSNILIKGPTGSGKTYLLQTIAKVLNVPFTIVDATSLTEAGYTGNDVESILSKLITAANGNVKLAEKGIVFIDEIDKISCNAENSSSSNDISGEGVQHALLKIIEGADVSVPSPESQKNLFKTNVTINTENILFICGGAFEGLNNQENSPKKLIGFDLGISPDDDVGESEKELPLDAFIHYGMIPEFMGRLPVIIEMDDLTQEDLAEILTKPQNALIKEYKALLDKDGVELEFEPEAIEEIARIALKRKSGARGLRSIMDNILTDIMYYAPDNKNKLCLITKETVHTKVPIYRDKQTN